MPQFNSLSSVPMDFVKLFVKLSLVFQLLVIQSSWSIPVTYKTYSCPTELRTSNTHLVFEKVCYEFVTNRKDYWDGARHDCNNRGGDLAIVSNSDIQYFLQTTLQNLNVGNHGIWIGLNDRHREGHFTWVDGTSLEYSHWAVHEGNGLLHFTQDCVQIQMGDHGLWHDRECKLWPNRFSYVCQYPAVATVHIVKPDQGPAATASTSVQTNTIFHTSPTSASTTSVPSTNSFTTIPSTIRTVTTSVPLILTSSPDNNRPVTTSAPLILTSSPDKNFKTTALAHDKEVSSITQLPNTKYPSASTMLPNREYPLTSTMLPNREYPLTSTMLPNREYPLASTMLPNREYPLASTMLPNTKYPSASTMLPNREYPLTSTMSPNREYPLKSTMMPDRKFPSKSSMLQNREYPSKSREYPSSSTIESQNREYLTSVTYSLDLVYPSSTAAKREYPSSRTDNSQGHFLTPQPDGSSGGCREFICTLDCSELGYVLGPDDCPSCRCNV